MRLHSRYFRCVRSPFQCHGAGLAFLLVLVAVTGLATGAHASSGPFVAPDDPWTGEELIQPEQLTALLAGSPDSRPRVVCVGFKFLYESGHVPGSKFYGPARETARLQDLEAAAKQWPRDRELVIYCGCCPLKQCPNVRPAFAALKAMGFTRLRLLDLEKDFRTDWKGLPAEKSPQPDQK